VKEDGTTVSLEKAISDDLKRWDKSCVEHGYSFCKTEDPSHIGYPGGVLHMQYPVPCAVPDLFLPAN